MDALSPGGRGVPGLGSSGSTLISKWEHLGPYFRKRVGIPGKVCCLLEAFGGGNVEQMPLSQLTEMVLVCKS